METSEVYEETNEWKQWTKKNTTRDNNTLKIEINCKLCKCKRTTLVNEWMNGAICLKQNKNEKHATGSKHTHTKKFQLVGITEWTAKNVLLIQVYRVVKLLVINGMSLIQLLLF